MRVRRFIIVACALALVLSASSALAKKWSEEREKAVGAEVAAHIEGQYEAWEDEDAQKQIEEIVAELTPHTDRPDVEYLVKLLDTDEINACSIPGGRIYVHRGLLEEVQSVDELAAVMAHEIAHNCTYDAMEQGERNKKLFIGGIAAALVAIFIGADTSEVSGVLAAGSYLRQGILSRYSIEMEQRADTNAVRYLVASKYDPVGLLTFMDRLAAKTYKKARLDYGIYETHPQSTERCAYIIEAIYDAGLEINRRAVTKWDPPTFESIGPEDAEIDPKTAPAKISLWGEEIVTISRAGEYPGIDERAEAICNSLTEALAAGLALYEIRTAEDDETVTVTLRNKPMMRIHAEDVQSEESSPQAVADGIVRALARAMHREELARRYH